MAKKLLSLNQRHISAGSRLEKAISEGPEVLQKFIDSGEIEELHDVMPIRDPDEDEYLRDTNHEEIENMHNISHNDTDSRFPDDNDHSMDDDDARLMDQDMRVFNPKGGNNINSKRIDRF